MTNAQMLKLLLQEENRRPGRKFTPHIIPQKGAPMIAQDMPDYGKFCANYPADCEQCREYLSDDRSGLFCLLWEKTFPGKVKWYEKETSKHEKMWGKKGEKTVKF